jgi:hypothetical protein
MNRFSKRVTIPLLLVAGVLVVAGCGKSRPEEAVLSDDAVVGNWLESPPKVVASARRAQTEPQKFLRHVTLNADKTFVFTLRTMSGDPTKDDKQITGTWEIDGEQNMVMFTVTDNGFKAGETGRDWVPESLHEMTQREIADRGMTDIIYATDLASRSAKMVREP